MNKFFWILCIITAADLVAASIPNDAHPHDTLPSYLTSPNFSENFPQDAGERALTPLEPRTSPENNFLFYIKNTGWNQESPHSKDNDSLTRSMHLYKTIPGAILSPKGNIKSKKKNNQSINSQSLAQEAKQEALQCKERMQKTNDWYEKVAKKRENKLKVEPTDYAGAHHELSKEDATIQDYTNYKVFDEKLIDLDALRQGLSRPKIDEIIEAIKNDTSIGRPERLKGKLTINGIIIDEFYSRKLTKKHRLVYYFEHEKELIHIAQCGGHYKDT